MENGKPSQPTLAEEMKAESARLSLKVLGQQIAGKSLSFEEALAISEAAEKLSTGKIE